MGVVVADNTTTVVLCPKKNMPFALCCCTLEVKYRKKGGGCKVLNDRNIHLSDIDSYLTTIVNKPNFHSLLGVRMVDIHHMPVSSIAAEDSDDSEGETVETDTASAAPAAGVVQ